MSLKWTISCHLLFFQLSVSIHLRRLSCSHTLREDYRQKRLIPGYQMVHFRFFSPLWCVGVGVGCSGVKLLLFMHLILRFPSLWPTGRMPRPSLRRNPSQNYAAE